MSAPADAAIALMGRLSPLRFWRTLHDLAVTAAVGFSDSQFERVHDDMRDSRFAGEAWLPHVEAVMHEAARLRSGVN